MATFSTTNICTLSLFAHQRLLLIHFHHHSYYSFGGVANATEEAYMLDVCNSSRYETSELYNGEDPDLAFFGEWWIATECWSPSHLG